MMLVEIVLAAVHFDDETLFEANKIDNEPFAW